MKLEHQRLLIGLLKAGQQIVDKKDYHRKKIILRGAYPDYGRSLVARRKEGPERAGVSRAIGTGITGAILGTLIARIISNKPKALAVGAGLGGIAGAVPGYISGRDQALSDYTKMLWLRRMGIKSLDELPDTHILGEQSIEKYIADAKAEEEKNKTILLKVRNAS